MKSRTLVLILVTCLATLIVACSSASSTPTAEPTPTPQPLNLITADPNTNPDAFFAAFPTGELACAEVALGGRVRLVQVFSYEDDSVQSATSAEISAILNCLSDDTARAILIGQIDRRAGGLTSSTVSCMTSRSSGVALKVILARADTYQPDAYLALIQTAFCTTPQERLALEVSAGADFGFERVGYIDALQCAFDYRDPNGNAVLEQIVEFMSSQAGGEIDFSSAQGQQTISSLLAFIPAGVECGLVTDEDFADSGFTALQFACLAREGGTSITAWLTIAEDGGTATAPSFGQIAELLTVFETCEIDLEGLITDQSTGSGDPTLETEPTIEVPSFEELDLPLTEAQLTCLQSYISEDDILDMIQSGQPTANLWEALAACDISLEDLFS